MNCALAQQLLSEAIDREPIPADLLEQARAHCRECAECSRFVRGLATIQRSESPAPPARLHDRVMASLDAEAARMRTGDRTDASSAAVAAGASPESPMRDRPVSPGRSVVGTERAPAHAPVAFIGRIRGQWQRDPWRMAAWVGTAAVVFVALGFAAVIGIRSGMSPSATSSRDAATVAEDSASDKAAGGAPTDGTELSSPAAPPATSQSAPALAPGLVPDYITMNGVVYRSSQTSLAESQLTTAGVTRTALDSGGDPHALTVYATPTSGRVAIVSDGRTLAFDMVTRTFDGQTYVLTSRPIVAFGTWPSLPSGFSEPATPEGAPTFVPGPKDDLGVQVYTRPGIAIDKGLALAPKTPPNDPAQGNPNWTWWTAVAK